MDELNNPVTYSIIGMLAVFLVVAITLPSAITGNLTIRDILGGQIPTVGSCTSTDTRCPEIAFCSARLMKSEDSKLQGTYNGDCITKYPAGYLCKRHYQCASNQCVGIDEAKRYSALGAPQIGGCA